MRRLILLRHGEAERHASRGGDLDRRLTAQGTADAAAVGRVLAERGLVPDVALVSIATRTVETWEAASAAFPNTRTKFLRRLYDADAETLWTLFGDEDAHATLLLGHNPGIHVLAARLAQKTSEIDAAAATRLHHDFPPAACAVFGVEPGKVTLEAVIFPEDLRGRAA